MLFGIALRSTLKSGEQGRIVSLTDLAWGSPGMGKPVAGMADRYASLVHFSVQMESSIR
jgi:hypothetical protein